VLYVEKCVHFIECWYIVWIWFYCTEVHKFSRTSLCFHRDIIRF